MTFDAATSLLIAKIAADVLTMARTETELARWADVNRKVLAALTETDRKMVRDTYAARRHELRSKC